MIYFNNAAEFYPKPLAIQNIVSGLPHFESGRSCNCDKDSDWCIEFRNTLKNFLNVPDDYLITITNSATESANLILRSLDKNDIVAYDDWSHNCIIRTCNELSFRSFPFDKRKTNPTVCCFTHESNVSGEFCDIDKYLSKHYIMDDCKVVIDISQSIGNVKIDVSDWTKKHSGIYVFGTFHKAMGSICGCGFIIHPKENFLKPLITGGTGTHRLLLKQPKEYPFYLESGTKNTMAIACAVKSIKIKSGLLEHHYDIKQQLVKYFDENWETKTSQIVKDNFDLYKHNSTYCINLISKNYGIGESVTIRLEKDYQIITRFGNHCSPLYTPYYGYQNQGILRLSFNEYNTTNEIDCFFESLNTIMSENAILLESFK